MEVAAGVLVGAGVEVSVGGSAVDVFSSPTNGSVAAGASVAGGSVAAGASVAGGSVAAGAAAPQDVINNDKTRIHMIRRTIHTHFRIQAGQQVDSVINV